MTEKKGKGRRKDALKASWAEGGGGGGEGPVFMKTGGGTVGGGSGWGGSNRPTARSLDSNLNRLKKLPAPCRELSKTKGKRAPGARGSARWIVVKNHPLNLGGGPIRVEGSKKMGRIKKR